MVTAKRVTALTIVATAFATIAGAAIAQSPGKPASDSARGSTAKKAPPQLVDGRLELGERVFGIVVAEEPRAYALADLSSAGAAVHDVVGGNKIDVGLTGADASVLRASIPVRAGEMTSWRAWSQLHPDTSLWRPPAVAEPEVRREPGEIRVRESRGYRTDIGCAAAQSRLTSTNVNAPGLYVISGTIENTAQQAVDHVVLRFELVDAKGKVVYRDEGFNRSAEALAAPKPIDGGDVVPIAAGGSDSFRMILLSQELPDFETPRVTVMRVY